MKIEFPFLAALLLIGTNLLARIAVQGVEQTLVATVIEYGLDGLRATKRILPNTTRFASSARV